MQRQSLSAAGRGLSRLGLLGSDAGQPRRSAQAHTNCQATVRRPSGGINRLVRGREGDVLAVPLDPLRSWVGRLFSWPRSAPSPGLGRSLAVFCGLRNVSGGALGNSQSQNVGGGRVGARVCVRVERGRETYPIQSSGGGRVGGLTHSGDWRRCRRNSAEYRSGMVENRGGNDHELQGCDVACMR